MAPLPLPKIAEITWVLEELFDREVRAKPCDPLPVAADTGAVVTLVDDTNRVRAVWLFDISLANIVGTALALGHPDKAIRATTDGGIPADIQENVAEVVNVGASAINGEGRVHVRLGPAAFVDDGSFGHDIWRSIARQANSTAGETQSYEVSLGGYGSGRMTLQSFGYDEFGEAAA